MYACNAYVYVMHVHVCMYVYMYAPLRYTSVSRLLLLDILQPLMIVARMESTSMPWILELVLMYSLWLLIRLLESFNWPVEKVPIEKYITNKILPVVSLTTKPGMFWQN